MARRNSKPALQIPLFASDEQMLPIQALNSFPSTRYQGSKRKIIGWLWEHINGLPFDTALDAFGGTGVVSYLFKTAGKQVVYNDLLKFNWQIGLSLVANNNVHLAESDIECVLEYIDDEPHPDFIARTFKGIYFTDEENQWLDRAIFNVENRLNNPIKQALARFAIIQACISKRPYNLFHRANLYMRQASVDRSFGNKATWDTPFEIHFKRFVAEANLAIFDNRRDNTALNLDVLDLSNGYDLVYIDPPYLNSQGVGVDYRDFYHFLEGIMNYPSWGELIDYESKHKRLTRQNSAWLQYQTFLQSFEALVTKHRESILIVSYRDNGIPSAQELFEVLGSVKSNVVKVMLPQKYVLSKQDSHELLFIAQ